MFAYYDRSNDLSGDTVSLLEHTVGEVIQSGLKPQQSLVGVNILLPITGTLGTLVVNYEVVLEEACLGTTPNCNVQLQSIPLEVEELSSFMKSKFDDNTFRDTLARNAYLCGAIGCSDIEGALVIGGSLVLESSSESIPGLFLR